MKKIYLSILAATILFTACKDEPQGEEAQVTEARAEDTKTPEGDLFTVTQGSTISFYGATPSNSEKGTFGVSKGAIYVKDGNITAGNVTVDVAGMTVTTKDLPNAQKEKLKNHLLGKEFLNIQEHPEVIFDITEVTTLEGDDKNTHTITGNLAMNGKTNSITFPANVEMAQGKFGARASFVINRKDWGIVYGNDKSLGDKWIYDKVEMTLAIEAVKK